MPVSLVALTAAALDIGKDQDHECEPTGTDERRTHRPGEGEYQERQDKVQAVKAEDPAVPGGPCSPPLTEGVGSFDA